MPKELFTLQLRQLASMKSEHIQASGERSNSSRRGLLTIAL